jgi:hypothetical protein
MVLAILSADLTNRIQAEFEEMPGMRLTLAQAERLFGLDSARCDYVLQALTAAGLLQVSNGVFSVVASR